MPTWRLSRLASSRVNVRMPTWYGPGSESGRGAGSWVAWGTVAAACGTVVIGGQQATRRSIARTGITQTYRADLVSLITPPKYMRQRDVDVSLQETRHITDCIPKRVARLPRRARVGQLPPPIPAIPAHTKRTPVVTRNRAHTHDCSCARSLPAAAQKRRCFPAPIGAVSSARVSPLLPKCDPLNMIAQQQQVTWTFLASDWARR
jgi:hypothetical protein